VSIRSLVVVLPEAGVHVIVNVNAAFTVSYVDTAGAAGNLDAVRHFAKTDDLRDEIVDARVWAGVDYRFSGVAGVSLGRNVARYELGHAFRATR